MNTNGYMIGSRSSFFNLFPQTMMAIHLTGADGFPMVTPERRALMRDTIGAFCQQRTEGCDEGDEAELEMLMVEHLHTCEFELAFPRVREVATPAFESMVNMGEVNPSKRDVLLFDFVASAHYAEWLRIVEGAGADSNQRMEGQGLSFRGGA